MPRRLGTDLDGLAIPGDGDDLFDRQVMAGEGDCLSVIWVGCGVIADRVPRLPGRMRPGPAGPPARPSG